MPLEEMEGGLVAEKGLGVFMTLADSSIPGALLALTVSPMS